MKKVLYYLSSFPVLSQTFITREIEALVSRGSLDVHILSLERGDKSAIPQVLRDKVTYYTVPKKDRIVKGLLFAFQNPILSVSAFFRYWNRPLSLGTAMAMVSLIREMNPDLIHANWISEGGLMANILSDLTGIPYSIECHAEDIWLTAPADISKRVSSAKFVLTCTAFNKEYLKKFLDKHLWEKIKVIYHHLNSDTFGGRTTQFNETPQVYLVGRMVEKKGFSYFIQAARILKDRGVKFSAKIAGDAGTEKTNLVNLTKELGLESYISFTNEVPFSEHSHNYLESDVFVMPSIKPANGNLDGIPNVIVEAMLAGLPVVATNVSAIPELIEDGKTGFLINQKDEKMLADRLEILLRDRSKREEFGKAGRQKVLQMFNTISLVEDSLSSN